MKKSPFLFVDLGTPESFQNLATFFNTIAVNDVISLPASAGTGDIRQIPIARGLQASTWDVCLKEPLDLIKIAAMPETSRVFTITYSFTDGYFLLQSGSSKEELRLKGFSHVLFDPGNRDVKFTLLPEVETKALVLSIDAKWLESEFGVDFSRLGKPVRSILTANNPVLYYHPADPEELNIASGLFHHFIKEPHDMFYIKGNILLLLSRFFKGLIAASPAEMDEHNVLHYEKMKEVESILLNHIEGELPNVSHIAKEVALSESSLKRYFRMVFRTSIYDYYLKKKMEYAKTQLTDKMLPVKEVAYMLGYENCGSFIRTFKKFYNLPPGHFQKAESRSQVEE